MRITSKTKTKDVLPLLNEERLEEILDKIPRQPLPVPLLKMSVGGFLEASEKDYPLRYFSEKRACKAFGMMAQYRDEMKQVNDYLARYEVPKTKNVEKASQGIPFPSWQKRTLCDLVGYFHLHSTEEAERVPVTDWLLMVEDTATSAMLRYNLNMIEEQQAKGGRK